MVPDYLFVSARVFPPFAGIAFLIVLEKIPGTFWAIC